MRASARGSSPSGTRNAHSRDLASDGVLLLGAVDDSHSALAEEPEHAIGRDPLGKPLRSGRGDGGNPRRALHVRRVSPAGEERVDLFAQCRVPGTGTIEIGAPLYLGQSARGQEDFLEPGDPLGVHEDLGNPAVGGSLAEVGTVEAAGLTARGTPLTLGKEFTQR